jgi:hypothetical protein
VFFVVFVFFAAFVLLEVDLSADLREPRQHR